MRRIPRQRDNKKTLSRICGLQRPQCLYCTHSFRCHRRTPTVARSQPCCLVLLVMPWHWCRTFYVYFLTSTWVAIQMFFHDIHFAPRQEYRTALGPCQKKSRFKANAEPWSWFQGPVFPTLWSYFFRHDMLWFVLTASNTKSTWEEV